MQNRVYVPMNASEQEIRIHNYLTAQFVFKIDIKETLQEMGSQGIRVQSPTLQSEISKRKVKPQNSFLAKRMGMQKNNSLAAVFVDKNFSPIVRGPGLVDPKLDLGPEITLQNAQTNHDRYKSPEIQNCNTGSLKQSLLSKRIQTSI